MIVSFFKLRFTHDSEIAFTLSCACKMWEQKCVGDILLHVDCSVIQALSLSALQTKFEILKPWSFV